MSLPRMTIVGNLTSDPELRTTRNGRAVANFTIASNENRVNKQTGEWETVASLFVNCQAWNTDRARLAENIANTLHKGMRVIAQGSLQQSSYQAKDGTQRTTYEMNVHSIGPDLARYECQVDNHQPQRSSGFAGAQRNQTQASQPPASDPWGDFDAQEPDF